MIDDISMKIRADELIRMALAEDVTSEDVSTSSVLPAPAEGEADLLCKQSGVVAGLPVFARVFELLGGVRVTLLAKDGDRVEKGQKLASLRGDMRAILTGERTALNFLQRMSGIATYTAKMAALLAGSGLKLVDTRKTTPNMRLFEKYAVRMGGGFNHRYNLSDAVLLKDNHIGAAGGVREAVARAKAHAPFTAKIEVEAESVAMAVEAVEAGADIVMLDNMSHDDMKEAVRRIAGRAIVEISGNVTAENAAQLKDIGADVVSCGALTHSAPILDVSLKNLHPVG